MCAQAGLRLPILCMQNLTAFLKFYPESHNYTLALMEYTYV